MYTKICAVTHDKLVTTQNADSKRIGIRSLDLNAIIILKNFYLCIQFLYSFTHIDHNNNKLFNINIYVTCNFRQKLITLEIFDIEKYFIPVKVNK